MAGEASKIQYTDPTAQIMQMIGTLGGTKTTTSTGGNTAGLQQVLDQQLQQITPDGISSLIESIFKQGATKVPEIAAAYGQAVGARSSGNSPMQLALGDLQKQLSAEAMKQLLTSQNNASNTAAQLANASKSTTSTTKPKSTALTYAPFLLAHADKLKKVKDLFTPNADQSTSVFGAGMNQAPGQLTDNFSIPNSGYGSTNYGFGSSAGFTSPDSFSVGSVARDLGSSGLDFSGVDFGSLSSGLDSAINFIDNGEGVGEFAGSLLFADGGLVDKGKMLLRANPGAEAAFNSGGDQKEKQEGETKKQDSTKSDKKEDKTGRKSLAVQFFDYLNDRQAPGYANGGVVRGYASGGKVKRTGDESDFSSSASVQYTPELIKSLLHGANIRGINAPDEFVAQLLAYAVNDPYEEKGKPRQAKPSLGDMMDRGDGGSSEGSGIATGQVGTIAENEAAINGMLGMVPGFGMVANAAMSALGISHSSMNPVVNLGKALMGLATGASSSPPDGLPGTMGNTDNSVNDNPDAESDTMGLGLTPSTDGFGAGPSNDGNSDGVGGGGGDASSSVGTASGDGPGYARGGAVKGPKKPIDDINIRVTGGEYIMPVDSVEALGVDFLDFLRDSTHTPIREGAH